MSRDSDGTTVVLERTAAAAVSADAVTDPGDAAGADGAGADGTGVRRRSVTIKPEEVEDFAEVRTDSEMVLSRASIPMKDLDELEKEEAEDAAAEAQEEWEAMGGVVQASSASPDELGGFGVMGIPAPEMAIESDGAAGGIAGSKKKKSLSNPFG